MKINILSPGRFHVCDLARELYKQGLDVKFYSFVPTKRAVKFGLPAKCNCSLVLIMAPFLILERRLFRKVRFFANLRIVIQDYITSLCMRKCDVVIAMSGNFTHSIKTCKKNGSIVIVERGSKHILEQRRILESIPSLAGTKPVPDKSIQRELADYALADYVSIASQHVKRSFLIHNYPEQKLFVNPYGVDLSDFYIENTPKTYDIIMVGNWCYQKGVDLLIEACNKLHLSLLHVGCIGDVSFPKNGAFYHHDAVDQKELVNYYRQARVFCLPSRQDGFGMVLSQALACGLPLVCSKDTGGRDIATVTGLDSWIFEMDDFSVNSLCSSLEEALNSTHDDKLDRNKLGTLSWQSYGSRYADFLRTISLK